MKMIKPIVLLPVLLLVAACGGAGAMSADSGSARGASPARSGPANGYAAVTGTAAEPAHGRPAALQRAVISHGSLEMRSRDVARTRDDVLRLLARWGGQVANEESGSDAHGRMTSVSLVLRVPSADFETAMADLAKVAHTVHQEISSQDVTTQVIDVTARLRAKEDSIRRIEQLLGHAKSLGQIIAIETDLGNRQAELDSLKRQHAWLADQTSLSTVDVSISRTVPPVHHKHHARAGLLAGLSAGWTALGAVAIGVLTVVGAVLPFALVVAVLGFPAWLVWRRRRSHHISAGAADAG